MSAARPCRDGKGQIYTSRLGICSIADRKSPGRYPSGDLRQDTNVMECIDKSYQRLRERVACSPLATSDTHNFSSGTRRRRHQPQLTNSHGACTLDRFVTCIHPTSTTAKASRPRSRLFHPPVSLVASSLVRDCDHFVASFNIRPAQMLCEEYIQVMPTIPPDLKRKRARASCDLCRRMKVRCILASGVFDC